MTLEDVIEKVMSKKSPSAVVDPPEVTKPKVSFTHSRPRSHSLGAERDWTEISSSKPVNLLDLFKSKPRELREGTPDSDLGYGTSVKSSTPDDCLLDLVNSMKLEGITKRSSPPFQYLERSNPAPSLSRRQKLSSISEQGSCSCPSCEE